MKILDIKKLKEVEKIEIQKTAEIFIQPSELKNISLKRKILFEFTNSNIFSKIVYRCVAQKNTNLDLTVSLSTKDKTIQKVEAQLEIYVLNLSQSNMIRIKPYLEIDQKNIKFEHKVTIGEPNTKWIKYLNSRGLSKKQAFKLISHSFITG